MRVYMLGHSYGVVMRGKQVKRVRYHIDTEHSQIVHSLSNVRWDYGKAVRGDAFFYADKHRSEYTHHDAHIVAMWLSGFDLPLRYNSDLGVLL